MERTCCTFLAFWSPCSAIDTDVDIDIIDIDIIDRDTMYRYRYHLPVNVGSKSLLKRL